LSYSRSVQYMKPTIVICRKSLFETCPSAVRRVASLRP